MNFPGVSWRYMSTMVAPEAEPASKHSRTDDDVIQVFLLTRRAPIVKAFLPNAEFVGGRGVKCQVGWDARDFWKTGTGMKPTGLWNETNWTRTPRPSHVVGAHHHMMCRVCDVCNRYPRARH